MAEQWITKEYEKTLKDENGNVLKGENGKTLTETVTNKYRVDVDFVPKNANEICDEFMTNYCIAKGKEDIKWLMELSQRENEVTIKKGKNKGKTKKQKISSLEIRKEFILKYFDSLKAKEKEVPKRDIMLKKLKEALEK